ncbi:MAG: TonB-dependent receptor [Bacteroidetes bacterium]|nr:TonB-dependent receptor [Bacteroidota bacterium]
MTSRPYVLVAALACLLVSPSAAQDTLRRARRDTIVYSKSDVVVTATRSQERILEVPLAITVVDPILFRSSRGFGLDEALAFVPGALVQSRNGNQDVRVTIRGFGARGAGQRSNAGTTRGIRYYIDGIPETEPDGRTSLDLIDVGNAARIEVIRSNASALYGNAAGGVVSITTTPTDNTPYLSLQTSTGSFGLFKQSIQANTPLNNGQLTATFTNTAYDGWREHSASKLQQANVGIRTKLTDNTRLNVFLIGAYNSYQIPGALTAAQYAADPRQAQNDPSVYNPTYVARDERRINQLGRIGMTLEHNFTSEHGISAMSFLQSKVLQRSERNTWRDFDRYHVGGNIVYHFNTSLTDDVYTKLLVGIDEQYQDGAIRFYNLDLATKGRGTQLRDNKKEGANNFGLFVQDELMFNTVSVLLGLRYDDITYSAQNFINPSIDQVKHFTQLTPKLGLAWRIEPSTTLYANLGGGIEVPAFNEIDPPAAGGQDTVYSINPLLDPIRTTTYELGLKGIVSYEDQTISTLSYDVAAFYINVRNDIIPYRDGRFYMTAGSTHRLGGELGGTLATSFGLSVRGMLTYMQSEYDSYTIDSGFVDPALAGKTASYAGNEQPGVPSIWYSLQVRYDIPNVKGLYALTELRSVGTYYANDANTIVVDPYTVLDAALGAEVTIAQALLLQGSVRMNNIAGTQYMASAWINPDSTSGGVPYIESGIPRNFVVNIGLKWSI